LALTFFPGLRVLYHEHDAPEISNGGIFMNLVARARKSLARRADMCVFPNRERLESFQRQLGPCRAALCVWNCPSIDEVLKEPRDSARNPIWLLYHGSIVPDRLPLDVIDALSLVPDTVRLRIVGYETAGTRGYVAELIGRAKALGITDRVEFLGAVPQRSQLLELTRKSDIGFALMPMTSNDTNLRTMTGASNKPFDYMACGLALIVSDLPAWRQMFVAPGYAVCCDPNNAESIASAIRSLSDNPKRMRSMGESGRRKILSAWNYDEAFAPVLEKIVTRSNLTSNSKQPALAASPIEK
jgi:glycosyltransferase involved in cell wall biosynthesis